MEVEPLQRAIAVIEGVTEEICIALGDAARDYLNPDVLFVRAEYHIKNGLSVDAAKTEIIAHVLPKTEEYLKEQKSKENIQDGSSLERKCSVSKDEGLIKREINSAERKLEGGKTDTVVPFENDPSVSGAFTQIGPSTSLPLMHPGPSTSSAFTQTRPSTSTGITSSEGLKQEIANDIPVPSQLDGEPQESSCVGSPEIRVLSPPPKAPAPVIDLSDDSSCYCGPSPCDSDIVVVGELQNQMNAEQKSSEHGEGSKTFCSKTDEELHEFENLLDAVGGFKSNCQGNGIVENNVKVIVDQEVSSVLGKDVSDKNTGVMEVNIKRDDTVLDSAIGTANPSASQTGKIQICSLETNSDQPEKDNVDAQSQKQNVQQNSESDFYDSDSFTGGDPSDVLWKDAKYICSLLPYFEIADVHQTLIDNFYHPDREAHVLQAYIELALDRNELVPDTVFVSLNAARKRSYEEVGNDYSSPEKRQKISHSGKADGLVSKGTYGIGDVVVEANDPVPSTSGIVVPNAGISNGPSVSPHAFSNNPVFPQFDSEREKWCKEKFKFICEVVGNVEKDVIRAQLNNCFSDVDVEALLIRLLEEDRGQGAVVQLDIGSQNESATHSHPSTSALQAIENIGGSTLPVVDQRGNETPSAAAAHVSSSGSSSEEGEDAPSADTEDRIMAQIETLSEMFSDADPDYLRERVVGINANQEHFQGLVEELMERKDYPKMEEYLKRQKRLEIKKKFIEGMSVEEFLEYFEDPEKVFCDTSKKVSATYMEDARRQLSRDLPFHLSKDIDSELRKNNYHYLPTLRALEANKKLSRRKTKRPAPVKESDLDDIFIKEFCYVRMQVEIKEYLLKKDENKRRAFLWAKTTNQLQECGCCYDDEVLEEDMDVCNAEDKKHKFCCNCIRRFVEEEIGQGRISFHCLEGDCKAEFSLSTLKKVMKPSVFSNILARKQLEEIAAAGIEDLESCPFCNFQTIMPNQGDKVFKCLNPECMKDSCRLCKEPNHVPLRCEEVEKQNQKDARTFLENKMTEAMVRECWKCKTRFIKADGCNKMRCSCGAMMCYICKKAIKGYDHFEDNPVPINKNKCPLWSNSEKIHAEEVRDAAKKLKDELEPGIELKHDPTKDLPEVPKHLDHRPALIVPAHNHPNLLNPPPPAHQRRRHPPRYAFHFGPPQAHHHHHHAVQVPIEPHHQAPQPAHQHPPRIPPIHLVINPARNAYHHHHHHHYHHHVRHQDGARQDGDDQRHLLDQINEFNEIFQNVHDHQQQHHQQQQNQPLMHQNPARFPAGAIQRHPPQNVQNLPHEPAHDPFLGGI